MTCSPFVLYLRWRSACGTITIRIRIMLNRRRTSLENSARIFLISINLYSFKKYAKSRPSYRQRSTNVIKCQPRPKIIGNAFTGEIVPKQNKQKYTNVVMPSSYGHWSFKYDKKYYVWQRQQRTQTRRKQQNQSEKTCSRKALNAKGTAKWN